MNWVGRLGFGISRWSVKAKTIAMIKGTARKIIRSRIAGDENNQATNVSSRRNADREVRVFALIFILPSEIFGGVLVIA
jgi:uncharacterized protein YhbP (UPF0306 family)